MNHSIRGISSFRLSTTDRSGAADGNTDPNTSRDIASIGQQHKVEVDWKKINVNWMRVIALRDSGQDLNKLIKAKGQSAATPLVRAIRYSPDEEIVALVAAGADVNRRFGPLMPPMAYALRSISRVKLLLDLGADANATWKTGSRKVDSIVRRAAADDLVYSDTIHLLLAAGANPNLGSSQNSNTALMNVAGRSRKEKLSRPRSEQEKADDLKGIKAFLDAGANIQARNDTGHTALFPAIESGRKDIVECFLAKDQKLVNLAAKGNWTPLMHAVKSNNVEMIRMLVRAGADVNSQFRTSGKTAWDYASLEIRRQLPELEPNGFNLTKH